MFILRDLLTPLQQVFSETAQGRKRKVWFVYTLLAVGLLKQIKGRWACLPLDFRFYLMKKDIEAKRSNLTLYGLPAPVAPGDKPKQGRPKKYGTRLGSVDQCAGSFRERAESYRVFLYGKQRDVLAFSQVVTLKTMKCPVRVVWVFRRSRYVALVTTDLSLSVEQIIEF